MERGRQQLAPFGPRRPPEQYDPRPTANVYTGRLSEDAWRRLTNLDTGRALRLATSHGHGL